MLWVHIPYTKHQNELTSIQESICDQNELTSIQESICDKYNYTINKYSRKYL